MTIYLLLAVIARTFMAIDAYGYTSDPQSKEGELLRSVNEALRASRRMQWKLSPVQFILQMLVATVLFAAIWPVILIGHLFGMAAVRKAVAEEVEKLEALELEG